jgi:hypothetical protein
LRRSDDAGKSVDTHVEAIVVYALRVWTSARRKRVDLDVPDESNSEVLCEEA